MKPDYIAEYHLGGEEFENLQTELENFYNLEIPYFNPFDAQSIRENIPIKVPRVSVSYGDMTRNIIEAHDLKVLESVIMKYTKDYSSEDLKIINCWATDMQIGQEGLMHHHLPTTLSGVYYHAIDPTDSQIEFSIEATPIHVGSKLGKLMIWPAWVLHRIPLKTGNTHRRSISFNLVHKDRI